MADNLLRKSGLSVESVEGYLSARRIAAEESTEQDGVAFGKSAFMAFQRAEAEASAHLHTYLGIEHLLLGLLAEESGEATNLFASAHVDREQMRQILVKELQ